MQLGGHAQRVVAADRDQRVDAMVPQRSDRAVDAILFLGRVGPRRAEDGAAQRQDAAHVGRRELIDQAFFETAGPSVLHAAHPMPELEGAASHGPDGRVQAGRVSTTGQDADAHGGIG